MRRRFLLFVASGLLMTMLVGCGQKDVVPTTYTAVATMFANDTNILEGSNTISSEDLSASIKLVSAAKAIILSDLVMDSVAEQIGYSSGQALPATVDVESVKETQVFRIIVTAENAELAVKIANTIAEIAPEKIASIIDGVSVKLISGASLEGVQENNSTDNFFERLLG